MVEKIECVKCGREAMFEHKDKYNVPVLGCRNHICIKCHIKLDYQEQQWYRFILGDD